MKIHRLKNQARRVARRISSMILSPSPARIKRVNFALTDRCNSRCVHCNIWKKGKKNSENPARELSGNSIKNFLRQMAEFSSPEEISLTGGEPFIRSDFKHLFRFIRNLFPKTEIIITTNALRPLDTLPENARDISQTVFVVSIDGIGERHDALRGVKNGFDRVMSNLEKLERSWPEARIGLGMTISPENCDQILPVFQLSGKKGYFFTMRIAGESGSYYDNLGMISKWTKEKLLAVEKDIRAVIDELKKSRGPLRTPFNHDLYFFSRMVEYEKKKCRLFSCHSGTHSLFVDAGGNVHACIFSASSMGNIETDSFERIWLGESARRQRRLINQGNCHCWTECETMSSLQRHFIR